jgi:hypothetical protein
MHIFNKKLPPRLRKKFLPLKGVFMSVERYNYAKFEVDPFWIHRDITPTKLISRQQQTHLTEPNANEPPLYVGANNEKSDEI